MIEKRCTIYPANKKADSTVLEQKEKGKQMQEGGLLQYRGFL